MVYPPDTLSTTTDKITKARPPNPRDVRRSRPSCDAGRDGSGGESGTTPRRHSPQESRVAVVGDHRSLRLPFWTLRTRGSKVKASLVEVHPSSTGPSVTPDATSLVSRRPQSHTRRHPSGDLTRDCTLRTRSRGVRLPANPRCRHHTSKTYPKNLVPYRRVMERLRNRCVKERVLGKEGTKG